MNEVLNSIRERRSIRSFTDEPVSKEDIERILEAARWTPSGLNNQPWRFVVIRDEETKSKLAECTKYSDTVEEAQVLIAIYLDKERGYDQTKDTQAIGACCQNIWLAAHSLGLGAVWNGEILNHKECVENVLETRGGLKLMALFCIGHPAEEPASNRLPLKDLIIETYE